MSRSNQHYMTQEERYKLEAFLRAGKSITWIADALNCSRQTIYNELARGNGTATEKSGYTAMKGQQTQVDRSQNKGRPLKLDQADPLLAYLEKKMLGIQEDGTTNERKRYSPAAALAAAKADGLDVNISIATLYNYIDQGVFPKLRNSDLWEKLRRKPRKKRKTPKRVHKNLPSIEERPKEIATRQEVGHWEMDLIVGPLGSLACLLTLTERTTREEIIIKLPNKKARSVRKAFNRLERKTPNFREKFKSITTDNGSEFLEYEKLKKSVKGKGDRFKVYYCHSFSAWEKGSNENHNRMIRRWFPKGTDFAKIKEREIEKCQEWMNNYPRKILNWKTPLQEAARRGPARLKPWRGAPIPSILFPFAAFEPTSGRTFNSVHICLLWILLKFQYFFLRHHLTFLHSMFKIPHTSHGIIGIIITITYKPATTSKWTYKLCIRSVLKLPGVKHCQTLKPPELITFCHITCYLSQESINMAEPLSSIIQTYIIMPARENCVQKQRVNICLEISAVHLHRELIPQNQSDCQCLIFIIILFFILSIQDNLLQGYKLFIRNIQSNIRDNLYPLCHNPFSPGTPYLFPIIMMISGRDPMDSGKRLTLAKKSGISDQFTSAAKIIIFARDIKIDIPKSIPSEKDRVKSGTAKSRKHNQAKNCRNQKNQYQTTTSGNLQKIPQSCQSRQKHQKPGQRQRPPAEDTESTPPDSREEPYQLRRFEKNPLPRQP